MSNNLREENMSISAVLGGSNREEGRYTVSVTRDEDTIQEAQQLRYLIFNQELKSRYDAEEGCEADGFDRHCDHVVVRRTDTGELVGTHRLLPPEGARQIGGLTAEAVFDLGPHQALRPALVELTRACVHPDHRAGPVITMLWAGVMRYMTRRRHAWVSGRLTLPLFDGGAQAAACWDHVLAGGHFAPARYHVRPHTPWNPAAIERSPGLGIPPKFRGYLLAGAWVCSEFAYNSQHDEASLYLLLSLENVNRHRREFLLSLGENLAR
ncbi:GNAT family N-acetyltransferase [Streptomyces sp. DK15]|uniref:GNAT family N-acetyltransferase n=1 Tax=Streptomyces sp. DK15 TaxID=2957499 RepID=UPI0029A799BC|nr:GNAT family N-acyltransferase [Streptomyces sp. DK15]MDX2393597.1 GNAT family N-acetyltransferase [Streptomyces sp. DK15]